MDLIKTDQYGRQIGYVQGANIDFEVGADEADSINDFEIELKRWNWDGSIRYGTRVFSPDTEYGGIVREISTDTSTNVIRAKGDTWRGMMTKKIIQPLSGQDYATASGELNSIIKSKVEAEFPGLFYGVTADTGVVVNNYQYDRYCTLHTGLIKMLKSVGYRLDIRYQEGDVGMAGYVKVSAVPINDLSSEYELTNDNNMNFTTDDNRRGINHLICLGKGDLKDRLVIHLYADQNGTISQTQQYFKGAEEIAAIYDSSGSERDDLIKNGIKELESKKSSMSYNMTMTKLEGNIDLGDIVGGKDYLTGISMKKPIGRKIWTISSGKEKVVYKLEGET